MRAVLEECGARLLIGEINLPFERLAACYGKGLPGAHLPFNFALIPRGPERSGDRGPGREYEASLPRCCVGAM
jgi:alpha-glucosidase